MTIMKIVTYPHAALKTPAKTVTAFDAALHRLLDDMAETMYARDGVGLAANQVDVLQRVTVIDTGTKEQPALVEYVNPEIVEASGEMTWDEGCLSFPELYERIKRNRKVRVRYQDRHGATHEVEAEGGLLAVALQHEIDHLNGVLFIDRMGPLKRKLALKDYTRTMKARREQGAAGEGVAGDGVAAGGQVEGDLAGGRPADDGASA